VRGKCTVKCPKCRLEQPDGNTECPLCGIVFEKYHDWEFILRKLGLLEYDHALALAAQATGILLMLCTFAWGGFLLYRQIRNAFSSPHS